MSSGLSPQPAKVPDDTPDSKWCDGPNHSHSKHIQGSTTSAGSSTSQSVPNKRNLGVLKEGVIRKWTNYYGGWWKDRYFRVEPGILNYSHFPGDPSKEIVVLNEFCKIRKCPGETTRIEIEHPHGVMHLKFESQEEKLSWLEAIDRAKHVFLNNRRISSRRKSGGSLLNSSASCFPSSASTSLPNIPPLTTNHFSASAPNDGLPTSNSTTSHHETNILLDEETPTLHAQSSRNLYHSDSPTTAAVTTNAAMTGGTTGDRTSTCRKPSDAVVPRNATQRDTATASVGYTPSSDDDVDPLHALLEQCIRTRQALSTTNNEVRGAQKKLIHLAGSLRDANFRGDVKRLVLRIVALLDQVQSLVEEQLQTTESLVTEESIQRRKMERSIKYFAKQSYKMERQMSNTTREARLTRRNSDSREDPHAFDRSKIRSRADSNHRRSVNQLGIGVRSSDKETISASRGSHRVHYSPEGVSDDDAEISDDSLESWEFFDVEEDRTDVNESCYVGEATKDNEELLVGSVGIPRTSSNEISQPVTVGSAAHKHLATVERRQVLPAPRTEVKIRLWSLLRGCIGKDLSRISMPVYFNEPTSLLQRIAEDNQYVWLLTKAAEKECSVERLMLVSIFTITPYASAVSRLFKPFNPLLGETTEYSHRGFKFLAEQVGHHPPVTAYYCENPNFVSWGSIMVTNRFTGKSLEVTMPGTSHIHLPTTAEKDHYTFCRSKMIMNNIIFGRLVLEMFGIVTVVNHVTGDYAVLEFLQKGWWDTEYHRVRGLVFDHTGKAVYKIGGNCARELWVEDCCEPKSGRPVSQNSACSESPQVTTPASDRFAPIHDERTISNSGIRHSDRRGTQTNGDVLSTTHSQAESIRQDVTAASVSGASTPLNGNSAESSLTRLTGKCPQHPSASATSSIEAQQQQLTLLTPKTKSHTASSYPSTASLTRSMPSLPTQQPAPPPRPPYSAPTRIDSTTLSSRAAPDSSSTTNRIQLAETISSELPGDIAVASPDPAKYFASEGSSTSSYAKDSLAAAPVSCDATGSPTDLSPPEGLVADVNSRPSSMLCFGLRCVAKTPPAIASEWTIDWDSYETNRSSRRTIWRPDPRPSYSPMYYEFGSMTFELNELSKDYDPSEGAVMPQTDSRFRPDLRAYEHGDVELANQEKAKLEENQRARARERENGEEDYNPRWFFQGKDSVTNEPCWLYNGEYWKQKDEGEFTGCINIF